MTEPRKTFVFQGRIDDLDGNWLTRSPHGTFEVRAFTGNDTWISVGVTRDLVKELMQLRPKLGHTSLRITVEAHEEDSP